ncbi:MAG: DASH complex subunit dam1 [Geoglossum umbratile]|nr:MAG: DASH complex subunit dam1 [Geoglossum umbratile]
MSSSTTPVQSSSAQRSASRNRRPSSRPTTPLRPSSRSSLRESHASTGRFGAGDISQFPLESLEPAFAELSDSMADLETNFEHLQSMHESLSRFTESFAGFLYGLNMNAFCVDFPEDDRYFICRQSSDIFKDYGKVFNASTVKNDWGAVARWYGGSWSRSHSERRRARSAR